MVGRPQREDDSKRCGNNENLWRTDERAGSKFQAAASDDCASGIRGKGENDEKDRIHKRHYIASAPFFRGK